jgi:hypothetical protein
MPGGAGPTRLRSRPTGNGPGGVTPPSHLEEVMENRPVLHGDERFRSPGPSAMGSDPRPEALVVTHGGPEPAGDAGDKLFVGRPAMSGRRHPGADGDMNRGLNRGSTHLEMQAEPHCPPNVTPAPVEGGITLPKDQ